MPAARYLIRDGSLKAAIAAALASGDIGQCSAIARAVKLALVPSAPRTPTPLEIFCVVREWVILHYTLRAPLWASPQAL